METGGHTERDKFLKREEGKETADQLRGLLDKYKDKRVLVLAPTGAGKSTVLQHIPEGIDMDNVIDSMPADIRMVAMQHVGGYSDIQTRKTVWPEREYTPGSEESKESLSASNEVFKNYMNEHVQIEPGRPVFGSVVVDADVIIYLKLPSEVYAQRLEARSHTHRVEQPERSFALRQKLEADLETAKERGVHVEELDISE